MTSILKTLSGLFSGSKSDSNMPSPTQPTEKENMNTPENDDSITPAPVDQASENFSEPPAQRRVIQAPVSIESSGDGQVSEKVLIKAEPSETGDQCKLMVNRPLFKGYSWYFKDFESTFKVKDNIF